MCEAIAKPLPWGPFTKGQKVLWFRREDSDWRIPVTVLEDTPATDDPDARVKVQYSTCHPEEARISMLMTQEAYDKLRTANSALNPAPKPMSDHLNGFMQIAHAYGLVKEDGACKVLSGSLEAFEEFAKELAADYANPQA